MHETMEKIALLSKPRVTPPSSNCSPHIGPVCLPDSSADFTGQLCWVSGWGKDSWGDDGNFQTILKETSLPIMNKSICRQKLKQTRLGPDFNLYEGFLCAGGEEGKDACKVRVPEKNTYGAYYYYNLIYCKLS